jgi:hypothetical protein
MIKLIDVKKGDWVRRKEGAKTTYIKEGYDRATKRFELIDVTDIGRSIYLKGSVLVDNNFEY